MLDVCLSLLTALLLQAAPSPATQPSSPATHPDLTGTWTLNREQSTPAGGARAPEGGREGGEGRPPGGMGRGGGGMGGMGRGGGMGGGEHGGRSPEQMAQQRAVMEEILQARPKFTIVAHEEKITFAEPDGWTRTYEANSTQQKHQELSGTVETKSRWNGPKLEIEMKTSGGLTVTRTYEISGSAPRQLIVTTKLSGGPERGERPPIKWVYDEVTE